MLVFNIPLCKYNQGLIRSSQMDAHENGKQDTHKITHIKTQK